MTDACHQDGKKSRIAILHPRLSAGGSEARALWGVTALKQDYDVTLISSGTLDLDRLNQFYETNLHQSEFTYRQVRFPPLLGRLARYDGLRGSLVARFCRNVASEYDLMISAYNPCDYGVPAIHFVGDISFSDILRRRFHPDARGPRGFLRRDHIFRKAYLGLCKILSSAGNDWVHRDLVVANSDWTARLLKEQYGIEAPVVYPPVAGDFPLVPYEGREDGFVWIGRVSPEKRIERAVEILGEVRRRGHDVHLHIVGQIDDTWYGRYVRDLCTTHGGWITLEGRLLGNDKRDLMARHKYGINTCEGEAFGIAVAEMVRAGAIVFVPEEGGQAEIVSHPLLTFRDNSDAVEKIQRSMGNRNSEVALRKHLSEQAVRFSVENFTHAFRDVVAGFLDDRRRRDG